jgi:hypothetical protein
VKSTTQSEPARVSKADYSRMIFDLHTIAGSRHSGRSDERRLAFRGDGAAVRGEYRQGDHGQESCGDKERSTDPSCVKHFAWGSRRDNADTGSSAFQDTIQNSARHLRIQHIGCRLLDAADETQVALTAMAITNVSRDPLTIPI